MCKIFVIAGNVDEVITRNGLVLFILQPKLRERKETKQFVMSESEKARSFIGLRRSFSRGGTSTFCLSFSKNPLAKFVIMQSQQNIVSLKGTTDRKSTQIRLKNFFHAPKLLTISVHLR